MSRDIELMADRIGFIQDILENKDRARKLMISFYNFIQSSKEQEFNELTIAVILDRDRQACEIVGTKEIVGITKAMFKYLEINRLGLSPNVVNCLNRFFVNNEPVSLIQKALGTETQYNLRLAIDTVCGCSERVYEELREEYVARKSMQTPEVHTEEISATNIMNDDIEVDEEELESAYGLAFGGNLSDMEIKLSETKRPKIEEEEEERLGTDDISPVNKAELEASGNASKSGAINHIIGDSSEVMEDVSDVGSVADIEEIVAAVMQRIEGVYRSCLEIDRPHGMLYDDGVLTYNIDRGGASLTGGVANGKSVFEKLYAAIIHGAGARLNTAKDLRNVPNADNVANQDWDYYPAFMLKYALGFVDGQKCNNWKTFSERARESITNRLKLLYKKDILYEAIEKIEKIYSNAILVISYEPGAGLKLRVSFPGVTINIGGMESAIRQITTYKNAGITITPVGGALDLVDVQILLEEDKFLNRPYWAYKAMKLKLDNKEPVSLYDGLPIGRLVNGDIVNFKLDPSSRFLTFLAAGSGAGKGVLTLSIVAAAVGSGVPTFYMDFKPDMAPIFWDIEQTYKINTFTFDGMAEGRPGETNPNHILGVSIPSEVQQHMKDYAGAIHYLKCLALMCAMAKYRANTGAKGGIMFIFDETQAMQSLIKSAVEKANELKSLYEPKKADKEGQGSNTPHAKAVYSYVKTFLDWVIDIDTNMDIYINTTGRKSSTFCLFIAQNSNIDTWRGMTTTAGKSKVEIMSKIIKADTIFKILGRGNTTSKYGLGGDAKKSLSNKELQYITNNRFFGMYDGKTTDGATVTVFKPFLTLNTDNPLAECWTKGMGKRYGYGTVSEDQYIENIKLEHPGEKGFSNQKGIHAGTGLLGLTSMYCGGNKDTVSSNFAKSWEYCIKFFEATGMNSVYGNPKDYMFDLSTRGLIRVDDMINFSAIQQEEEEQSGRGPDGGPQQVKLDLPVDEPTQPEVNTGNNISNNNSENASNNSAWQPVKLDDTSIPLGMTYDEIEEIEEEPVGQPEQAQQVKQPVQQPQQAEQRNDEQFTRKVNAVLDDIYNTSPNGADLYDFASKLLKEDTDKGYLECDVASAVARKLGLVERGYLTGYDFPNNSLIVKETPKRRAEPVEVEINRDGEAYVINRKDPTKVEMDTSRMKKFYNLNENNSINCKVTLDSLTPKHGWVKKMCQYSPRSAEKYIAKIWKACLDSIVESGMKPALITRVYLQGGLLYINGKVAMLNGILGGDQDIRLRDIVNYTVLFKRFTQIRELRIDDDTYQAALLEFGNNPEVKMFELAKKLGTIIKIKSDGSAIACTRESLNDISKLEKDSKDAKNRMAIDLYCKAHSTLEKGPGDAVWGWQAAKKSFTRMGEAYMRDKKPSVAESLWHGFIGTTIGAIGGLAWGSVKLGYKTRNLIRDLSSK